MALTREEYDQLLDLVTKYGQQRDEADAKKLTSREADSEAAQANATATQAKLDEAAADLKATVAFGEVKAFVDRLSPPPPS